jgi:tetratricopeptide (TPR) repeat protein
MSPESGHPVDEVETHLIPLASKLEKAMELRAAHDLEGARSLLREVLLSDPRLAEPRLELAHIAATVEDWEEAEEQARAAVHLLRSGGQWTAAMAPKVLQAFATNLLGEVIYRSIEDGELMFRDEAAFTERWNEAAALFAAAHALDPSNDDARYWTNHVRAR